MGRGGTLGQNQISSQELIRGQKVNENLPSIPNHQRKVDQITTRHHRTAIRMTGIKNT
jgi:hypothetical protein